MAACDMTVVQSARVGNGATCQSTLARGQRSISGLEIGEIEAPSIRCSIAYTFAS